jgi:hypothetical protein
MPPTGDAVGPASSSATTRSAMTTPRRRPWVIGTGLDVWEIIHMLEDFGSPEAHVSDTRLELAVHGARL